MLTDDGPLLPFVKPPQESSRYIHSDSTNLGISDLKATRRQNQGHQRCREEHLNDRDVPFFGLIAFGEGVRREYPETFGRR